MGRKKLEEDFRVRVDAQLKREVNRVLKELQKEHPYSELNESEALRYLIKLGLAAGSLGYSIGPDGALKPPPEEE